MIPLASKNVLNCQGKGPFHFCNGLSRHDRSVPSIFISVGWHKRLNLYHTWAQHRRVMYERVYAINISWHYHPTLHRWREINNNNHDKWRHWFQPWSSRHQFNFKQFYCLSCRWYFFALKCFWKKRSSFMSSQFNFLSWPGGVAEWLRELKSECTRGLLVSTGSTVWTEATPQL